MASAFGWTWEYIDEFVTVPRLLEIVRAWGITPPLHRAFALFFGLVKPPTAGDHQDDVLQALMAAGVGLGPGVL